MDPISSSLGEITLVSQQIVDLMVRYGINILAGFGTLFLGLWLSGRAATASRRMMEKLPRADSTLIPVISAIIRYAVMVITLIVALGQFGVQTTSIIAVLGAAGLAIGLALQGTLSNVAAGVMLLVLRPFEAGDWIESGTVSGTVNEIGLFTTQIITFNNIFISVPNSTIWSSTITNHSRNKTRRLDLDIGIGYETDLSVAETAMLSLADDPRILITPEPQFLVVAYGDNAITVRLRCHALYDDYFTLHWDLMRQLKDVLDSHNISIPFPQRVIHYQDSSARAGE